MAVAIGMRGLGVERAESGVPPPPGAPVLYQRSRGVDVLPGISTLHKQCRV